MGLSGLFHEGQAVSEVPGNGGQHRGAVMWHGAVREGRTLIVELERRVAGLPTKHKGWERGCGAV